MRTIAGSSPRLLVYCVLACLETCCTPIGQISLVATARTPRSGPAHALRVNASGVGSVGLAQQGCVAASRHMNASR
jgi:hypothetical protein